jgi:hypothetical protein
MITAERFAELVAAVRAAGYGDDITWSEACALPKDATAFACEAVFVICNSGMHHRVARGIYERVIKSLVAGESARTAFRHDGKAAAIDRIWAERDSMFAGLIVAEDKVEYCASLPWIGAITKYHLAKNFGVDVAKPDVHLKRLADREGCTPQALCDRLAAASGLKARTVDVVLWRACAVGILDSKDKETSHA